MARINVDERWWSDPRRGRLTDLLGSRRLADGLVLEAWRVGQEYEAKGKHVPAFLFEEKELECLIRSDLALKTEFGVYIKGSKKRVHFLSSEIQSIRGKASARARMSKYGTALPFNAPNRNKEVLAEPNRTAGSGFPEHSSSSSSSSSKRKRTTTHSLTTARVCFDFDRVYEKYPRKMGKKRGYEKLKMRIKTREDYEKLTLAVDNYARYCLLHIKSPQYVKHWATFVSEWEDWVNPDDSLFKGSGVGSFDFRNGKEIEV